LGSVLVTLLLVAHDTRTGKPDVRKLPFTNGWCGSTGWSQRNLLGTCPRSPSEIWLVAPLISSPSRPSRPRWVKSTGHERSVWRYGSRSSVEVSRRCLPQWVRWRSSGRSAWWFERHARHSTGLRRRNWNLHPYI